jgi:dTDP-4-dehydrorhamnose reductase
MIGRRAQELYPSLGWAPLSVDVTNAAAVDAAVANTDATVVVNLAAYTDVSGARQQYGDIDGPCYRINADGARNVARACAKAGKHFVQISTDYVFEGDRDDPYLEIDDGDARTDWYGTSKRLAEENIKESDARWAILRLSFPYQRQSARKTDLVRRIGRQLRAGAISPMFTDQIITPSFSDDAVAILACVARTSARGTFHAVGPEWFSPYEIAVHVAVYLGFDVSSVPSSSLREYIDKGGRPFPWTLRMSNQVTLATLHQSVLPLFETLRLPGWVY